MHLRNIPLLLLLTLSFKGRSQADSLMRRWTNEESVYSVEKTNDSLLIFNGAGLHEGGYTFGVRCTANHCYITRPPFTDSSYIPAPSEGEVGDVLTYKRINGARVLLITSKSGLVHGFFRETNNDTTLRGDYNRNKTNFELAGRYIDRSTKKIIEFFRDEQRVEGLTNTKYYTFPTAYDFPEEVLAFTNGKTFSYEKSDTVLTIYKAIPVDDELYKNGARLMTLDKIPTADSIPGKYPFTATRFMTAGALSYFKKSQLRIMRNEIYARHGYIFKSDDLRRYFESQPWYKPQSAAVEDQLTEIEKLNVRLIEGAAADARRDQ